jgi:phospholipid transport system substrate-binding protein
MTYARRFLVATNPAGLSRWFALGLLLSSVAWATESAPIATVNELHAGLIAAAERRLQPWAERYAALQPLIAASHDLDYIGRFTLRRQWAELPEEQQSQFRMAFENLAVSNYVARFGGLSGASFEVLGEAVLPRGRHQVMTLLKPLSTEPVTLNYVLHQSDVGGWRIINVVANDVSDLALKRAEYQRLFRAGGLPELLKQLDSQAARLEDSAKN